MKSWKSIANKMEIVYKEVQEKKKRSKNNASNRSGI